MNHGGRFAVHRIIQHAELTTKRFDDSLQAETHPKHRNSRACRELHQIRHAKVGWPARAWRYKYEMRREIQNQFVRNTRAISHYLGAGLPCVIGQRVDKAVVIVDE